MSSKWCWISIARTLKTVLISVSLALSQTPVHAARPWIHIIVHHVVPVYSPVRTTPTQVGKARLS